MIKKSKRKIIEAMHFSLTDKETNSCKNEKQFTTRKFNVI